MNDKEFITLMELWIKYGSMEIYDALLFLERHEAVDESRLEPVKSNEFRCMKCDRVTKEKNGVLRRYLRTDCVVCRTCGKGLKRIASR